MKGFRIRDLLDTLIINKLLNPSIHLLNEELKLILTAANTLHNCSKIMPFSDNIVKNSLDPYIVLREAAFNKIRK